MNRPDDEPDAEELRRIARDPLTQRLNRELLVRLSTGWLPDVGHRRASGKIGAEMSKRTVVTTSITAEMVRQAQSAGNVSEAVKMFMRRDHIKSSPVIEAAFAEQLRRDEDVALREGKS